jgi:hypothetical protein
MRAIVVELPEPPLALGPVVDGTARELGPGTRPGRPSRGEGRLAPRRVGPEDRDLEASEGEPL